MTYARVVDGAIDTVQGALPSAARRLDTDEWVMFTASTPVATVEATGWYPVVETARPPDTASTTFDYSVELVNGKPTVVWTERAKTPAELEAQEEAANHSAIVANLNQDMDKMQATVDASNATINANPATYIKDIARMNRRLGRLALNDLDGST